MKQLALSLLAAATAHAGLISTAGQNNGITINATDITGFATTGNLMAGMLVTGTFSSGLVINCAWAALGADSGGCSATSGNAGFSISQTGDTFNSAFELLVTSLQDGPGLISLLFQGLPGFTVFDRTFGAAPGTSGSESGADATGTTSPAAVNGSATYANLVATLGNPPVGDLFSQVLISFEGPLPAGATATWIMDTDNIGLRGGQPGSDIPEPSSIALVLTGAALIGASRFRRQ